MRRTEAALTAASAASIMAETEKASTTPRASSLPGTAVPEIAGRTSGCTLGMTKRSTPETPARLPPASTLACTSATSPVTRTMYLPGQIVRASRSLTGAALSMVSVTSKPRAMLESSTPPIALFMM